MVIYNVSVAIDKEVEADWKQWMEDVHIPDVLATGYFLNASIFQQLEPPAEEGRSAYQIRYTCQSLNDLESYQANSAAALQADHTQRYQGRFAASRTILQMGQTWNTTSND
ncbi:MAG: DUF4286 family protein [Deltaproteobacteria bacterium]|nr:MAG: DUF4286 family protein [Deltaproteobacteria bacterium]